MTISIYKIQKIAWNQSFQISVHLDVIVIDILARLKLIRNHLRHMTKHLTDEQEKYTSNQLLKSQKRMLDDTCQRQ